MTYYPESQAAYRAKNKEKRMQYDATRYYNDAEFRERKKAYNREYAARKRAEKRATINE